VIWEWAVTFGIIALLSAYIGIVGIQSYIKKSGGKQSIVAFVMMGVLIFAIVILPLKAIFLMPKSNSCSKVLEWSLK